MPRAPYPILEHPGDGPAIIEPRAIYRKRPRIPERVTLCFFGDVLLGHRDTGRLTQVQQLKMEGGPVPIYVDESAETAVAVAFPGLGAPFAATVLEELIALGGTTFTCCGGAGVLDGAIPVGSALVPTAALRCEGTSYHYARRGRWARPDPTVVNALRASCREQGRPYRTCRTWTTDGVFRETPAIIARRRAEGCLAVDMEAAAQFAVARFRGVRFASIFYAGDDIGGERWKHRDWDRMGDVRAELFDVALRAVRNIPV